MISLLVLKKHIHFYYEDSFLWGALFTSICKAFHAYIYIHLHMRSFLCHYWLPAPPLPGKTIFKWIVKEMSSGLEEILKKYHVFYFSLTILSTISGFSGITHLMYLSIFFGSLFTISKRQSLLQISSAKDFRSLYNCSNIHTPNTLWFWKIRKWQKLSKYYNLIQLEIIFGILCFTLSVLLLKAFLYLRSYHC